MIKDFPCVCGHLKSNHFLKYVPRCTLCTHDIVKDYWHMYKLDNLKYLELMSDKRK